MSLLADGLKYRHLLRRPEDLLSWEIACALESLSKKTKLIWFHVPNEARRSPRTGMLLKLIGMVPGAPDFVLVGSSPSSKTALLEVKTLKGKLSPTQTKFMMRCEAQGVAYHVVRDVDSVRAIVRDMSSTV